MAGWDREAEGGEVVLWYLKQLLPLLYISTYTQGGRRWLCIWRMWFGRSFAIRKFELVHPVVRELNDAARGLVDTGEAMRKVAQLGKPSPATPGDW